MIPTIYLIQNAGYPLYWSYSSVKIMEDSNEESKITLVKLNS